MEYTIYRIEECNYIGSTKDLGDRIYKYKTKCYSKNCKEYNFKIYRYIRENNLDFDNLTFTILLQLETNIPKKLEQMFIDKYDSINNGCNTNLAHYYGTMEEYNIKYSNSYYENKTKKYVLEQIKCAVCNISICRASMKLHIKKKTYNIHKIIKY